MSRGPDCCVGYTDPALTAAAFDADGWYRTGDIGVLDGDGYLTITDRISDIIIRGGENISAQEIEELCWAWTAVAEVAVVAEPDERLGEHAAAVVSVREGMAAPTLQQVRDHLVGRRAGPPEVARVDPRGRRIPPDAVGQGPEIPSPAAAGRGRGRGPGPTLKTGFCKSNSVPLETARHRRRST